MKLSPERRKYLVAYNRAHYDTISVEKGVRAILHEVQDKLTTELGHKPTISETIRQMASVMNSLLSVPPDVEPDEDETVVTEETV